MFTTTETNMMDANGCPILIGDYVEVLTGEYVGEYGYVTSHTGDRQVRVRFDVSSAVWVDHNNVAVIHDL